MTELPASPPHAFAHDTVKEDMVRWLERAVIGLNLCPFAKAVHVKAQIHYVVSEATDGRGLLEDLQRELEASPLPGKVGIAHTRWATHGPPTDVNAHPHLGEVPIPDAVDRFYTADVFMHTWDLARATGQDETLDPDFCRQLYDGMLPMDDILRASGQYGPRVDVPDDADVQTKLIAFIGRHP